MRYYAHYTFIYPDRLLINHVVELDLELHLKSIFPFETETAQTIFHSGIQVFLPDDLSVEFSLEDVFRLKPELKDSLHPEDVLIRRFRV